MLFSAAAFAIPCGDPSGSTDGKLLVMHPVLKPARLGDSAYESPGKPTPLLINGEVFDGRRREHAAEIENDRLEGCRHARRAVMPKRFRIALSTRRLGSRLGSVHIAKLLRRIGYRVLGFAVVSTRSARSPTSSGSRPASPKDFIMSRIPTR